MIANIKLLKKYCSEYTKIENYQEAVKSPLKYDLHHRLEIDEMQSMSDLIFLHLYYHRPPEELIFLEHGEHKRLHNLNSSEETRQKLSKANRGKPRSPETRQRMSNAKKNMSAETKQKMSEAHRGKHWHLENGRRSYNDKFSGTNNKF